MKRTIILFLIVFASITFAQSKPILPEWYRGLNVSADIDLEITYGDADQLIFNYTVRALEDSVQPKFSSSPGSIRFKFISNPDFRWVMDCGRIFPQDFLLHSTIPTVINL